MRIATWNINGVKARLETALAWVEAARPDILCLQEIKSVDVAFPREPFERLGYQVETHGQKGFNGVALLSRIPLEDLRRGLPGDGGDPQARYIEGVVSVKGGVVRVASIYLPNGNPIGTEKFDYKLAWMRRLDAHARDLLALEEPLVLAGDYNVIPETEDCRNPQDWLGDALFQPESRRAFRALKALGLTDALRAVDTSPGRYTFWDYQAGAWQRNNGIRIDHLLLSPQAADRLDAVEIVSDVRGWEKPSDHVPVVATLSVDA